MRDYNEEIFERRRKKSRFLIVAGFALFLVAAAALGYAAFFTGFFYWADIQVAGLQGLSKADLFPRTDVSMLQGVRLEHPVVKSFTVHKDYWNRILKVAVEEREPYAVWCAEREDTGVLRTKCYWFDAEGYLFTAAPTTEGALVRNVYDLTGRDLKEGDYILPEAFRKNLFRIFSALTEAEVDVRKIELLPLDKQEITALSERGARIHFSLRLDPAFTIDPMKELASRLGSLSYLDFRSENRVFYK